MSLGHSGCGALRCHCVWEEGRRRGREGEGGREGGQREEESKYKVITIRPSGYLDSCSFSMTTQSIMKSAAGQFLTGRWYR